MMIVRLSGHPLVRDSLKGHRGSQAGVIIIVFGKRGPTLVRISVLDVRLQNGQLLAPFPLNIWEGSQGLAL